MRLWHFGPLPPPCYVSPSLSLSALLLQRHMALWHANHSLITSHIPWNTSSALFLHVALGSQSSPPPRHTLTQTLMLHTLSFLYPPPPGAYPGASVDPTPESHKQPELPIELSFLNCVSANHTGSVCPHCLVKESIQHQDLHI